MRPLGRPWRWEVCKTWGRTAGQREYPLVTDRWSKRPDDEQSSQYCCQSRPGAGDEILYMSQNLVQHDQGADPGLKVWSNLGSIEENLRKGVREVREATGKQLKALPVKHFFCIQYWYILFFIQFNCICAKIRLHYIKGLMSMLVNQYWNHKI